MYGSSCVAPIAGRAKLAPRSLLLEIIIIEIISNYWRQLTTIIVEFIIRCYLLLII